VDQPNIGVDLLRIHSIISRGLDVSRQRSQAFIQKGYPDTNMREGLIRYVQALSSVLRAHHLGEDELAFPYFRDKLPDAPFDALMADHRQIERILGQIETAIDGIAADPEAGEALNQLHQALAEAQALWQPHIHTEQAVLSVDRIGPMLPAEEHIRLGRMFAEHSQQHSGPDYLVVPFLLYNLTPEERARMAQAMPPIVTQQLVPIAWKAQWEPMAPFLLE
jgi:hemerythrin-like domain-containing protein